MHRYRFLGHKHEDGFWDVTETEEVRHALQVLRLQDGDEVEVGDGYGQYAIGMIADAKKKSFRVKVAKSFCEPATEQPFALALGALKPGLIDDLIPFLSELSVDELHIFSSEGTAKARLGDKQTDRWFRKSLQSIKQCKRPWAMTIHTHNDLESLLQSETPRFDLRGVLSAEGAPLSALVTRPASLMLVCGSEKGFSSAETALIDRAALTPCSLGSYVLQAKHAVAAAAAVVTQARLELKSSKT